MAPPNVAAVTGKDAPPLLSPRTYGELLSVEPPRLEDCDLALMNLLCASGLPNAESLNVRGSLALLDGWAMRVKSETQRHFYRFQKNPAEFENSEGYFRMLMMAVVLHEDFHVRYNPERIAMLGKAAMDDGFFADSRDVFLNGLLGPRRMCTCSSMPVLQRNSSPRTSPGLPRLSPASSSVLPRRFRQRSVALRF
jgi:hypothetical protein